MIQIKFDKPTDLYIERDGNGDPLFIPDIPTDAVIKADILFEDEDSVDLYILDSTPFNGSKYINLIDRVVMNVDKSLFTEIE